MGNCGGGSAALCPQCRNLTGHLEPLSKSHFLHPGKKRVWVPDEQDAYVEAEIKTEATGGKVTVETKDQKVELPLH